MRSLVARAFASLEANHGSLQSIRIKDAKVICRDELRQQDVQALVKHQAVAVQVKGFYPKLLAEKVAAKMLEDDEIANWSISHSEHGQEESDVDAVGMPHNVAVAKGMLKEYFDGSVKQTRKWRDVAGEGVLGPMDKLRLELDEVWQDGCMLSREKDSKKAFVAGIPRIMRPATRYNPGRWTRGFIHVDDLEIMRTDRGLFSANIYLQTPPSGGELEIWPLTFSNRWDFYRNAATLSLCLVQDADAQQVLRQRLGDPIVTKVDPGDLVLLCTQRPHSVRGPVMGGTRVSLQCFIQYEESKPFKLEG
mmetsp:Transcript_13843/g.22584  ORF Transcript_13843/g.22584 Transcript_13843/m.22584 type:complete len:306 (+) Transcript_13843:82-999(+)